MLFRRKSKNPCAGNHSHPEPNSDRDCTKVAYRMDHHLSVKTKQWVTFVWDNCVNNGGLVGVAEADTLDNSRDAAQAIMDEWDIEKVTRGSNS